MRYKREELFRYKFKEPLECRIKILRVNGEKVASNFGEARIWDMSPNGIKLEAPLDFQCEQNDVELEIRFSLKEDIVVGGKLVWNKNFGISNYLYGVSLLASPEVESLIIENLKELNQNVVSN
ncbi:hypothetical protein J2S74_000427 [Evansella vedderi]|uniref:PilZ domain-containing protein n=1 Tax=Evansella vedderi TaxID=38282 RepID=A0ABT9ZQ26_9BACI|nr:PilZ domain-containing protein [Evansella vedderi]MDQ0253055.1 hypothetical protein [Evansella vedderi]